MASLNQIAQEIADSFNKPFDIMFRERIKSVFKHERAKFIRQDIERNFNNKLYVQSYNINLIEVSTLDDCITTECFILRSENKIAKPIMIKGDHYFRFVGSTDKRVIFTYLDREYLSFAKHNKYTSGIIYYSYENGYLYVYNNKLVRRIKLEAAFENPEEAVTICDNNIDNCYTDDMEFPCPEHMINDIKNSILKTLIVTNNIDNQEVTINNETKNN